METVSLRIHCVINFASYITQSSFDAGLRPHFPLPMCILSVSLRWPRQGQSGAGQQKQSGRWDKMCRPQSCRRPSCTSHSVHGQCGFRPFGFETGEVSRDTRSPSPSKRTAIPGCEGEECGALSPGKEKGNGTICRSRVATKVCPSALQRFSASALQRFSTKVHPCKI